MNEKETISFENWTSEQWETYLSGIETPLSEVLLDDPTKVEGVSNDQYLENFSQLIGQNYTPHLKELYGRVFETLTSLQRDIINDFYWKGRSCREIARERGVSKTAILKAKNRAEKQIKKRIGNFHINQEALEEALNTGEPLTDPKRAEGDTNISSQVVSQ